MNAHKRVIDSARFLFTNPFVFLVYLPLTLLSFIGYFVSFDTPVLTMLALLYFAFMMIFTSIVFAFIILKTAYDENGKSVNFKQNFDLALKKFPKLLLSELIAIVAVIIISVLINLVSYAWTSNLGIAFSIVLSIVFLALMLKFFLFAPSCVLKGKLGFKESFDLVGWVEFLELFLLVAVYILLSYGLSYVPYAGYVIDSLVLGPWMIVILTMLYFDYLKK